MVAGFDRRTRAREDRQTITTEGREWSLDEAIENCTSGKLEGSKAKKPTLGKETLLILDFDDTLVTTYIDGLVYLKPSPVTP